MSKKKRKKKRLRRIILLAVTMLLAVIVVSGAYVYQGLSKLSDNAKKLNPATSIENKIANSANILVLGVDIGDAKLKNVPKRTDTMMLVHYNGKNKNVSITSIPRDTLVKINGKNSKINVAHAIDGVSGAVDAVEKLLDINIDYYGKVNYEGFRELIDSIGGVEMQISRDMKYDDDLQNLHIDFKKGETVQLDGAKSEQFFRWRKNNDGTGLADGDIGRIENQHTFIQKVFEKVKSPTIIPRIPGILNTIPKYAETNMSANELLSYAYNFVMADKITMNTLQGKPKYINRISYFIYDEDMNQEVLNKIHDKGTATKEVSASEVDINKSDVKVQVLNCTNKNGLAARYKEYLKENGFKNISVGNGTSRDKSVIYFNSVDKENAEDIIDNLNIKKYEINDDNSKKFDIMILLGKDFTNKN